MPDLAPDEQVALLMQGTEYGDDSLRQAMADELRACLEQAGRAGRPLRVYCGFDPRTSDLHLGHTVPMRKLRQFQELGHQVFFVIGRFTSLIGDPSDKDKLRPQITPEQAQHNAETYAEQAFRILDPQRTEIVYNDTWLSPLTFRDVIGLASNFTLQQFLTRETFRRRFERDEPIYLHETFYALMQGYDAYHLRADVQVGGSDQLFNIVTAARKLMESLGSPPNIGIILGILPGTDGVVKMSKSLGNHIALQAAPDDMYGKVMSVPDAAMGSFFRLVTRWTPAEIAAIEADLAAGQAHPRDVKMRLAREIVEIYHGQEQAQEAEQAFVRVFRDRLSPTEVRVARIPVGSTVATILTEYGMARSKSEVRRLVRQGGVTLKGDPVMDSDAPLDESDTGELRVGKRRFLFVEFVPPDPVEPEN